MKRGIIKMYYDFFDKKIEDSTLVVGLIWVMIFLAWFLSNTGASYKSNILEYNQTSSNTVMIDGKTYRVVFEELK